MRGRRDRSPNYSLFGIPIYIEYYAYRGSPDNAARSYSMLPEGCMGNTIIAALPGSPVSACEAVVSFIHALESKFRGSRVRSLPLLFIMELFGYRQVREAVENTGRVEYLIVASTSHDCFTEAVKLASTMKGFGGVLGVKECGFNGLARRVASSVRRGVRLE